MENDWTTTYYNHEEGFPEVLHATTVRLGIPGRPKYVGQEYVEHGTERCEVMVYISVTDKFVEIKP
jgi:hypothetical protein